MSLDADLKKAFKGMNYKEATVFTATVKSIDEAAKTISVTDVDDLQFNDVRLSAAEDDKKSLFIIPKVGSSVLVAMIGNDINTLFVTKVNEVEKIVGVVKELDIEDETGFKLHLKDGLMTINGDQFSGIVKAPELKTQVDKNTAILQAIQNAISGWTVIPEDGGAAFKTALASVPSMPRANLSNIENTKVKHG